MDESEPVQTKKKLQQEQERLVYKAAVRLQAELKEEERHRVARVHEAASSFNVKEWEDIQARVEVDEELAQRLQAEEREMYTEAKQARILVKLINQRKRYFAAQRAEERKNKPLTQAQQRTYMSNYIKHIGESEIEKVIPELAARISKRDAEEELDQESSKRQKIGESSKPAEEPKDKEEELSQEELQQMMIIILEQGINVEEIGYEVLFVRRGTERFTKEETFLVDKGNLLGKNQKDKEEERSQDELQLYRDDNNSRSKDYFVDMLEIAFRMENELVDDMEFGLKRGKIVHARLKRPLKEDEVLWERKFLSV
ncbi:hypothetical protein Tco_1319606 [Tanacetum coccineum]